MQYHCPDQAYPISHAIHLGRLASFSDACRECPHRHDTGSLPGAMVAKLTEMWSTRVVGARFADEQVEGILRNQITAGDVRQLASALGDCLRSATPAGENGPRVVLASDGRAIVPELLAAAAEGLRWAGCHAIDIGAGTVGSVAWSIEHQRARGGMLLGNARQDPQNVSLKFWGLDAKPFSVGGSLSRLQKSFALALGRSSRKAGPLSRMPIAADYLETLSEHFHALRPLRVVIDCASKPIVGWLEQLTANVGLEMIYLHDRDTATAPSPPPLPRSASRTAHVAQVVREGNAHFGMWIDGDGDVCQIVDERGESVPTERVLVMLARHLAESTLAFTVVLEPGSSADAIRALDAMGIHVERSGTTREAMHAAMIEHEALVGGGPSGRIWTAAPCPTVDALRTLALLLTILSQSDRPLSEVASVEMMSAK